MTEDRLRSTVAKTADRPKRARETGKPDRSEDKPTGDTSSTTGAATNAADDAVEQRA